MWTYSLKPIWKRCCFRVYYERTLIRQPFPSYRPQRSWAKVIFSQACLSTGGEGCLPHCMLGYPRSRPPWTRHPPEQTPPPPPPRTRHPPWVHTPWEADSSIQSTSGRYASYWNAFLFYRWKFCSIRVYFSILLAYYSLYLRATGTITAVRYNPQFHFMLLLQLIQVWRNVICFSKFQCLLGIHIYKYYILPICARLL